MTPRNQSPSSKTGETNPDEVERAVPGVCPARRSTEHDPTRNGIDSEGPGASGPDPFGPVKLSLLPTSLGRAVTATAVLPTMSGTHPSVRGLTATDGSRQRTCSIRPQRGVRSL